MVVTEKMQEQFFADRKGDAENAERKWNRF
jgi:hypothetical protein